MLVNPARSSDPHARSLWGPVTVRVAWELVLAGLQVRPAVLAEAREHALRCLPLGVSEDEAEALCSQAVAEWLDRLQKGRYRRPASDPDLSLPLTPAWRERLRAALDPLGDAVLRMHYGDGFSMAAVARSVAVDPVALEVARGGIREAMRTIAMEEGLPVRGWPVPRLDALVCRVARIPEPGCPGPGGLLTDEGRAHADRCPRCSRAVRLVRSGVLSPGDLFPPEGKPLRPTDGIGLLALMLHPDAHRHRTTLERALGELALPVGSNAWLIAQVDLDAVRERLQDLARAGTPARHHLRGSLVHGSGRWQGRRILGPLPHRAVDAARARPWGEVDGLGELPPPLPPPPKATRWWLAAGALVLATGLVGAFVLRPEPPPASYPVEARFTAAPGGWELRFDTDDLAVVDVVVRRGRSLELVENGVREAKGRWATGEGDYLLRLDGDEVLLLTSPSGVPALADSVAAAQLSTDPLLELERLVRLAEPMAGVARTSQPRR